MLLFDIDRPPIGFLGTPRDFLRLPVALPLLALGVAVAFIIAALDAAGVEG